MILGSDVSSTYCSNPTGLLPDLITIDLRLIPFDHEATFGMRVLRQHPLGSAVKRNNAKPLLRVSFSCIRADPTHSRVVLKFTYCLLTEHAQIEEGLKCCRQV